MNDINVPMILFGCQAGVAMIRNMDYEVDCKIRMGPMRFYGSPCAIWARVYGQPQSGWLGFPRGLPWGKAKAREKGLVLPL